MTSKQAFLARSLAAVISATMVPGAARADDLSDMRAQLTQLTSALQSMQAHQAELESRLAASEAARTQAQAVAPPAVAAATPPAAAAVEPARRQPLPPEQVAAADALKPPPGTIGANPFAANKRAGQGVGFVVPGTDTTIRLGGMIKIDAFDDLSGANLNVAPSDGISVPINGTTQAARKQSFMITARQTKINIGSETPTKFGPLKSFLEGDFYGTGGTPLITNSASFRLRQAYLSLGKVLVGQTWSVFLDLDAAAETLDMAGPDGNAYALRQPLIRYQTGIGGRGQLTLGIENPEADFLGADHTSNFPVGSTISTRVLNQVPDFTGRFTYKGDRVRVSVAGVVREINLDTGGAALPFVGPNGNFTFAGRASTWGFGAQFDATFKTIGQDTFTVQANGGPGIGRYMMAPQDEAFSIGVAPYGATNANPGDGAVLGLDGKLRPVFAWGATAWYRHYWSTKFRSNVVFGYQRIGDADKTLPINFPSLLTSINANLIWSPLPQVGFGVEYVRGYLALRGQTDANKALGYGEHGTMNRLQLSAQYNFF